MSRKCADCGMSLDEEFVTKYKIPIYGFGNGDYLCPKCYENMVL